jgi:septal ring factor EnvC (AmiA/AmiB activator)
MSCEHGEPVRWNPYNAVVQCHACGVVFVPADALAAAEAERDDAQDAARTSVDYFTEKLVAAEQELTERAQRDSARLAEIIRLESDLRLAVDKLAAAEQERRACEVCHTSSWAPTPDGEHCAHCELVTVLRATAAACAEAEAERDQWRADYWAVHERWSLLYGQHAALEQRVASLQEELNRCTGGRLDCCSLTGREGD